MLVSQKTTDNNSSGTRRGPKPRSAPPPLAPWQQSHSQKKKQQQPDNRHLFLFHATETPLLGRPSWRRREQRLLSDAAAVIGFLNATPRTMGPLSRPAIGNLCATTAARKHPAHVHVHTPVEMLTCAGINKKWQRSREGKSLLCCDYK